MDNLPPVYRELLAHLDALLDVGGADAAPVLLDADLFDRAELELDRHDKAALAPVLLPKIVAVLRLDPPVRLAPGSVTTARQPADVLAALATRLLAPAAFADLLRLAPEPALVEALGADAAPATHLLALAVVHKAATDATDTAQLAQLAAMDRLLAAVVVRWLASPDVAVGERGLAVLGDLLEADCARAPPMLAPYDPAIPVGAGTPVNGVNGVNGTRTPTPAEPPLVATPRRTRPGPGLLWAKFVGSRPLTAEELAVVAAGQASSDDDSSPTPLAVLAVRLCTGRHPATAGQPRQQSLAVDRLLRLLPRLAALDLRGVAGGGSTTPPGGLLLFAARDLVALDGPARDELLVRARDHFLAALADALLRVVLVAGEEDDVRYATAVLRKVLAARRLAPDEPLARHLRHDLPATVAPALADLAQAWLDAVLAEDDGQERERAFALRLRQHGRRA